MTEKRKALHPEYRPLANPKQLNTFLSGQGALDNRAEIAEQFGYNWHARKLDFETHFVGHLLMQATAYQSTRDHQWAAANDPLFAAHGAAVQISVSGLAAANRNRPIEPYQVLMQQVLDASAKLPHRKLRNLDKETWQGITDLLSRVDIFDATTLKLPPKLATWSQGLGRGDNNAALKLQLRLTGRSGAIKQVLLTQGTGSDSAYFEALLGDLAAQSPQIFVFDGGYWDLDTYRDIIAHKHNFVTKRGGNIKPKVLESRNIVEADLDCGYRLLEDSLVQLGDDPETEYRMLKVELTTGEQITLLTSLLELSANQVCLLYLYRWTIEIVFRWLKQLLQLDHLTSHDPVGILCQILTALIMWGLLIIAHQEGETFSPKQLWRELQAALHQAVLEFGFRLGLAQAYSTL